MKPREARRKVLVPARMRLDDKWVDVRIRNISSRGMMMETERPPARGTFVEVRRAHHIVVGQVRWSGGRQFGIRSQDSIDPGLTADGGGEAGRHAGDGSPVERRAADRARQRTPVQTAERSRILSSLLQYGLIALLGLCAAILAASAVGNLLSVPFEKISRALGGM